MTNEILQNKKNLYLDKIVRIAKESFNNEQKAIAKRIIENASENDIDAIYQLISQRVKTGFVFDAAPEVNHNCVSIVNENEKLYIQSKSSPLNKVEHKLIIGENYNALKNLLVTYLDPNSGEGLVDIIYIDPPYNTESAKEDGNDYKESVVAKKFVYRDKFTRDGWLNMMNERLKLAKQLLTDKGVIFVSIDDREHAYLKVLMDEIFDENNFIACVIWERAFSPVNLKKHFSESHDYVLCYAKNISMAKCNGLPRTDEANERYSNPDNDPRGDWTSSDMTVGPVVSDKLYEIRTPEGSIVTPANGRCWLYSKVRFEEMLKDNRIWFGESGNNMPRVKKFLSEVKQGITPVTIWKHEDVGHSQSATQELKSIFGGSAVFSYPKPVNLIKQLIQLYSSQDSIILDFFAGSGTTGQAVMEVNQEDNGNRQFILVTNNENNIATEVTWERLYRVINCHGSKNEKIDWRYSNEIPSLVNNNVRVFELEDYELNLNDLDKAKQLIPLAQKQFNALNENYKPKGKFDIYNELSSLNPYKKV